MKEEPQPPLFDSTEAVRSVASRADEPAEREAGLPTLERALKHALEEAAEKQGQAQERGLHFHGKRPYHCPEDDPLHSTCEGINPYTEIVQLCRRTIGEVQKLNKHTHVWEPIGPSHHRCSTCGQIRF